MMPGGQVSSSRFGRGARVRHRLFRTALILAMAGTAVSAASNSAQAELVTLTPPSTTQPATAPIAPDPIPTTEAVNSTVSEPAEASEVEASATPPTSEEASPPNSGYADESTFARATQILVAPGADLSATELRLMNTAVAIPIDDTFRMRAVDRVGSTLSVVDLHTDVNFARLNHSVIDLSERSALVGFFTTDLEFAGDTLTRIEPSRV